MASSASTISRSSSGRGRRCSHWDGLCSGYADLVAVTRDLLQQLAMGSRRVPTRDIVAVGPFCASIAKRQRQRSLRYVGNPSQRPRACAYRTTGCRDQQGRARRSASAAPRGGLTTTAAGPFFLRWGFRAEYQDSSRRSRLCGKDCCRDGGAASVSQAIPAPVTAAPPHA